MNIIEKTDLYNDMVCQIIDYLNSTTPDDSHWGVPNDEHWDEFKNDVKSGEAGITLESICTNIKEDLEIVLPNAIYNKLVDVCKFFCVASDYWQDILHE
jgi:hypothetical protein